MARRPALLATLALAAIRGYQRHLSPRKGFSCAYRCATGRDSCSAHGYRVIERCGIWTGLALLQRRLRLCGETHHARRGPVVRNPVLHSQRGDCDLGCDPSCLPDLSCGDTRACDGCSHCSSCDCDCRSPRKWWYNMKEQRRRDRQRRDRIGK